MRELLEKHCRELPPGTPALPVTAIARYLAELPGWSLASDGQRIAKSYEFKNFHETMEFLNALAWIVHREDHHPDLAVGYNKCRVEYMTHAIGGLSENDFICAAKCDALFDL